MNTKIYAKERIARNDKLVLESFERLSKKKQEEVLTILLKREHYALRLDPSSIKRKGSSITLSAIREGTSYNKTYTAREIESAWYYYILPQYFIHLQNADIPEALNVLNLKGEAKAVLKEVLEESFREYREGSKNIKQGKQLVASLTKLGSGSRVMHPSLDPNDQKRRLQVTHALTYLGDDAMHNQIRTLRKNHEEFQYYEQQWAERIQTIVSKAKGTTDEKIALLKKELRDLHHLAGIVFTAHPTFGERAGEVQVAHQAATAKITQQRWVRQDSFDAVSWKLGKLLPDILKAQPAIHPYGNTRNDHTLCFSDVIELTRKYLAQHHALPPRFTLRQEYERAGFSTIRLLQDHSRALQILIETIAETIPFARLADLNLSDIIITRLGSWVGVDIDGRNKETGRITFPHFGERAEMMQYYAESISDINAIDPDPLLDELYTLFSEDFEHHKELAQLVYEAYESGTTTPGFLDKRRKLIEKIRTKSITKKEILSKLERIISQTTSKEKTIALIHFQCLINSCGLSRVHSDPRINVSLLRHWAIEQFPPSDEKKYCATLTKRIASLKTPPTPSIIEGILSKPQEPEIIEVQSEVLVDLCKEIASKVHAVGGSMRLLLANCNKESDILTTLYLLKSYGIDSYVDIMPLFEDEPGIANAPNIMKNLFSNKQFRAYLKSRNNVLHLEFGHSDASRFLGSQAAQGIGARLLSAQDKIIDLVQKELDNDQLRIVIYDTGARRAHHRDGKVSDSFSITTNTSPKKSHRNIMLEFSWQGQDHQLFGISGGLFCYLCKLYDARKNTISNYESHASTLHEFSEQCYKEYQRYFSGEYSSSYRSLLTVSFAVTPSYGSRPKARSVKPDISEWRAIVQGTNDMHSGAFAVLLGGVSNAISHIGKEKLTQLFKESPHVRAKLGSILWAIERFDKHTLIEHADLIKEGSKEKQKQMIKEMIQNAKEIESFFAPIKKMILEDENYSLERLLLFDEQKKQHLRFVQMIKTTSLQQFQQLLEDFIKKNASTLRKYWMSNVDDEHPDRYLTDLARFSKQHDYRSIIELLKKAGNERNVTDIKTMGALFHRIQYCTNVIRSYLGIVA